jgi:hypothetical protein
MAIMIGNDTMPTLVGSAGDDVMFSGIGTTIPHSLQAGDDNDILLGGFSVAGDVLNGGHGSNLLFLGSFATTVEVGKHSEADVVYGFGEGDLLRIVEAASPHEVSTRQVGLDVVLDIGGFGGAAPDHATVTLKAVDLHDLHASIDPTGTLQVAFHHAAEINPIA